MVAMHTICDGDNCGSLVDSRAAAANPLRDRLVGVFWRVLVWMAERAERQRTRLFLSELSNSQLDDIGLTPEQARREAARPFWG